MPCYDSRNDWVGMRHDDYVAQKERLDAATRAACDLYRFCKSHGYLGDMRDATPQACDEQRARGEGHLLGDLSGETIAWCRAHELEDIKRILLEQVQQVKRNGRINE